MVFVFGLVSAAIVADVLEVTLVLVSVVGYDVPPCILGSRP